MARARHRVGAQTSLPHMGPRRQAGSLKRINKNVDAPPFSLGIPVESDES